MRKLIRVLLKASILTLLLGGALSVWAVYGRPGKLSLYNVLWKGRERFPYGDNPEVEYSFNVEDLDAMFASHELSNVRDKAENEFRVFVLGDSSVWGWFLDPAETIAGQLDGRTLVLDGQERVIHAYNLAYIGTNLYRDLMVVLDSLPYDPDFVVFSTTLASFPIIKMDQVIQVGDHGQRINRIADGFQLNQYARITPWTFSSIKRKINHLVRFQLYGFLWSATGIDQKYSDSFSAPTNDLDEDESFRGYTGAMPVELQAWDVLDAIVKLVGKRRILFVNEPIFIATGENHDLRYNDIYPRETYDAWRATFLDYCMNTEVTCIDAWNSLENERFTDTEVHYDALGAQQISQMILNGIQSVFDSGLN